jgi:hypothetical protein
MAVVKQAELDAAGFEADGDKEAAEAARRDARGAQSRLDSYLVDTRDLADDYPINAADIALENRRNAEAIAKRAAAKKAERQELLKSYPSARTEADGPEFPEDSASA